MKRVLLASRRPPERRAILNEPELVQFIKDRCERELFVRS